MVHMVHTYTEMEPSKRPVVTTKNNDVEEKRVCALGRRKKEYK